MKSDSGKTDSFWTASCDVPLKPALTEDARANVCIVGAGIAGMTTAYLLAREGKSVIVLDDGPIGGGETGRTTAHLVNVLDDRYFELERLHGVKGARLAAESHTAAVNRIEQIVTDEDIGCEFERLNGYLFVPPGEDREQLELELEAAQRAGIQDVRFVDRAPLPGWDTGRCLQFGRQAQFHPLKYLSGLAQCIERDGGKIYTRSHVEKIEAHENGGVTVQAGKTVRANAVVVATNTPINDWVTIHTKQAPYRTYVIGALVARGSIETALYWDTPDPYHYVRVQALSEKHDLLIVGGEDHKTGQAHDTEDRFDRLESWAREVFPAIEFVEFRWSGQVMEPVDGLAFIGRNPGDDNIYIATGDSGNGMTHGTIAGMLITDLIQGRDNAWSHLYDPSRKTLRAAGEFTRENLNVARQYLDYMTGGDVADVEKIAPGHGAVVRRGFQKIAAYCDEAGEVHEFSAVCPHLGCVVDWNLTEKTWDCPCHGSRFDAMGKVINGPANVDLSPADDDEPRTPAPVEAITT
ncbi:MAG TPA: FAD-dependent oxidoreductase [Bryobacteraceae bacterium]|nr:FAD-dependent oxidoreductase [Bryobacteraceae bacterium]